jgi:hypothetical protein
MINLVFKIEWISFSTNNLYRYYLYVLVVFRETNFKSMNNLPPMEEISLRWEDLVVRDVEIIEIPQRYSHLHRLKRSLVYFNLLIGGIPVPPR